LSLSQLWDSRREHHGKEVDELAGVFAEDVEGAAASVLEDDKARRSHTSHDVSKVWCQHKLGPLALDAKLLLVVAQKVTKVDVEQTAVA